MNAPTALPTMEQQRARFALEAINGYQQHYANVPEPEKAKAQAALEDLCRRFIQVPALIQRNGLGQAMAFCRSKGQHSHHEMVYQLLGNWLCQQPAGRVFDGADKDLLRAITSADMFHYMAAQNEALALLEWLSKFATAVLKTSTGGK